MKKHVRPVIFLFCFIFQSHIANCQSTIQGTISSEGKPIPFASVSDITIQKSIIADSSGKFTLNVQSGKHLLEISATGYVKTLKKVEVPENGNATLNIQLSAVSQTLENIVVLGSRTLHKSDYTSPLPIDIISPSSLSSTGQFSLDKQLQYRVPSFNSINVPVRDATTFFDPYELRNLGPSRTLVLINGKRKNPTSLLYVQFAPGRGESGVDLATIPVEAIDKIEILRDGASAQYGSDAIAGVINIILKEKTEFSSISVQAGVTSKGDGGTYGIAYNGGIQTKNKSFVNYTFDVSQQNNAVRSGIIDRNVEKLFFGGTPKKNAAIDAFLDLYPTAKNTNGTGDNSTAKFNVNFGMQLDENNEFYGNAGLVTRKSMSNANYRTPYWRTDAGLLHTRIPGAPNYTGLNDPLYEGYIGYVPTFEGDLVDYQLTLGFKKDVNGFKQDVSLTTGGNTQDYTVANTVNSSLGALSPTFFKPGGFGFSHIVGNYDLSKELSDKFSLAFGSEVRSETYVVKAGDTSSYFGEGSNSFPGMRYENASTNGRFNMGVYGDATFTPSSSLLLNGSIRGEKYSDFGNAFVWKISSRKKLFEDRLVLRGSLSTGFRAPTLHQIYTQSTVLSYISNNIQLTGLFNNRSKQAFLLGIPKLKAEKSFNVTTGLGLKLGSAWELTIDYYSIRIRDRIFYSSGISAQSASTPLGQVLSNAGVVQAQFFLNGIETQTSGIDYVLNYKIPMQAKKRLNINLAGNIQLENYIVGKPKDPPIVQAEKVSVLSPAIKLLLTDSRPKYKSILGIDYTWNKWMFNLNNSLIGPTRFQDIDGGGPEMQNIQQVFKPGLLTDVNWKYNFNKKLSLSLTINNLFNVIPKWDLVAINSIGEQFLKSPANVELLRGFVSFGGRYRILGASGSQFSQLGTTFQSTCIIKF